MIDKTEAIILVSEQREKTIIGAKTQTAIITINDNYLEGGLGYVSKISANHSILLIPYIGDIEYCNGNENILLEENQAFFFSNSEQIIYQINNPYKQDSINFYEILIEKKIFPLNYNIAGIDVQRLSNQLIEICQNIKIGQYESRKEDNYFLTDSENNILIYIISGAFEVQNRLLRPHDGLLLWNLQVLEFEALTNEAVILIIEFRK